MRGHRTDGEELIALTPEQIQNKIEERQKANKSLTTLQIKTKVEKKSWETLDLYFDRLDLLDDNSRDAAKVAIATIALVQRDRQMDIHERMLDNKKK